MHKAPRITQIINYQDKCVHFAFGHLEIKIGKDNECFDKM